MSLHGCDFFKIPDRACTIKDIFQFTKRYPNTLVGGILNTETYESGRGQHWVCLLFRDSTAYLLCSQAGNFNSFHDKNEINLKSELNKYGFAQRYNNQSIQKDNSNCGLYSTLFNLMALIQLDDLNKGKRFGMTGGLKINHKNKIRNLESKNDASQIPQFNITEIVKQIGVNAKNINNKGIYQLKKRLINWELD